MSSRSSYTVSFKKKVVEVAEKVGNREAARKFDINESNVDYGESESQWHL